MLRTMRIVVCLTIFCTISLTFGCSTMSKPNQADIPGWLTSIPVDDQYFYAIGVSGPTRRVNDAWNQAAQRARAELGRTIVTHITSRDINITTTRSEYTRQVIESLSDTELNYTEVVKRWVDQRGAYGHKNHLYVLVRMDKKQARSLIGGMN